MKRVMSRLWPVAALATASVGLSGAQEPREDAPLAAPVAPKYRVEFILFAHADVDLTEEIFAAPDAVTAPAPEPLPAPLGNRGDAASSAEDSVPPDTGPFDFIDPFGQLAGDEREPFRFRILRREELELGAAYARIEDLSAYRILAYGGWEQDGLEESAAQPMNLANLGIMNPTGTLRLHLSRFLHLSIDLEYQGPQTTAGPALVPDSGSLSELLLRPEFRMVEQRRARSGELHYVDHPLFGLLFMISPATDDGEGVQDDTGNLAPAA